MYVYDDEVSCFTCGYVEYISAPKKPFPNLFDNYSDVEQPDYSITPLDTIQVELQKTSISPETWPT